MKLRNLFLTAVAGILAFCGCDLFENDKPMLGITVEPDQVEIARIGGGSSIEIKTDQAWTITVPREADWLFVDPVSGTGSAYVNLDAGPNNGKVRSTTIIVKAGYDMVPVTVTQPGGIDSGDGLTMATAFTASEARYWINNNLASGETTPGNYYVKGVIHKIGLYQSVEQYFASNSFGNASFYIADDLEESSKDNDFYAYQVNYLGNRAFKKSTDTDVKVGDEVIIYGPLTLYNSTPETAGKGAACLVKLNDVVVEPEPPQPGGEAKGDGSSENPFNVAAALNAVANLTWTANDNYDKVGPYYVTGKVTEVKENFDAVGSNGVQYGNATFYIADEGFESNTFYCFRVKYFDNKAWKTGDAPLLAVGDEVVIYSELMNYRGNTPETVANSGYMIRINETTGNGTVDPPAPNNPVEATVAEFIAAEESSTQPYILVGTIGGTINTTYGNFDLTDDTGTVYVYGMTATNLGYGAQNDKSYASLNLKAGDKIKLIGFRGSYGDKVEVMYSYFVEKVGEGETPPTPPTTDPIEVSISEFNAAAESSTQKYILVGTMSNITSTTYGNFDLTDETGASVYVYGLTATDLGYGAKNDKSFANLGLAEGDKIKICGYRGSYGDKIEVVNAYFVEKVTGGDTPPTPPTTDPIEVSISEFNAAAESSTQKYILVGTMSNITSTTYGNFDLTDETGASVYVYGLTATDLGYGAKNDKSFANLGLAEGDKIKICGYRGSYGDKIEVVNAYFVEKVTGGDTPPADETATVSEILALETGKAFDSKPSLVVAVTTRGFVATDGTKNVYVYTQGTNFGGIAKVGDMVKFSGVKAIYSNMPEVTPVTSVEVVSSGNNVSYPNPRDITESAGTYTATEAEYVSLTGTLSVNGNYYNLALDAFADGSKMGSIVYPVEDLNAASYNGKKITITGYFNGLTSQNKYINIITTKIEEVAAAEPVISNFQVSFYKFGISLSWDATEGATSYEWNLYNANGAKVARGITDQTAMRSNFGETAVSMDNGFGVAWYTDSGSLNGKYLLFGNYSITLKANVPDYTNEVSKTLDLNYERDVLTVTKLVGTDTGFEAEWTPYTGEFSHYYWELHILGENSQLTRVITGCTTDPYVRNLPTETRYVDETHNTSWLTQDGMVQGAKYYFLVSALAPKQDNGDEGNFLLAVSAGRDHFTFGATYEPKTVTVDFTVKPAEDFPTASGTTSGTYQFGGNTFAFSATTAFYWSSQQKALLIGKKDSFILFPKFEGIALKKVSFKTGNNASENVIVDVCEYIGGDNPTVTQLHVNSSKLLKGTEYTWEIPNSKNDTYYMLAIANAYNAQFQNLTLYYE